MSDDDEYDAFGRPIERQEDAPAPPAGGFLPPTEQPPEREAWWATDAPAPPADQGTFAASVPDGELAGYVERAGAAVIDFLIRIAIAFLIAVVANIASGGNDDATGIAFLLAVWVVTPFYAPIAMTMWEGRTVGHRAVGTRIVASKGGVPVAGGKAVVREVVVKNFVIEVGGAIVSVGILVLVNYLWPLWDPKNEALHDKMCNTRVVKS